MNCPKCGRGLSSIRCSCGFRADKDIILVVGEESGKRLQAIKELIIKQEKPISADELRERKRRLLDRAAANAVIELIHNVGTPEYTEVCGKRIAAARTAFDALTNSQKRYVINRAQLESAETIYQSLQASEKLKEAERRAAERAEAERRAAEEAETPLLNAIHRTHNEDDPSESTQNSLSSIESQYRQETERIEEEYNQAVKAKRKATRKARFSIIAILIIAAVFLYFTVSRGIKLITDHYWLILLEYICCYAVTIFSVKGKMYDGNAFVRLLWASGGLLLCIIMTAVNPFNPAYTRTMALLSLTVCLTGLIFPVLSSLAVNCDIWACEYPGRRKALFYIPVILAGAIMLPVLVSSSLPELKSPVMLGDSIKFGSWEQDGISANGPESIQWKVREVQDGKVLLLCETCLEILPFNADGINSSWTSSTLRSWLNNTFYEAAFSSDEKQLICASEIKTTAGVLFSESAEDAEISCDRVFLPAPGENWLLTSSPAVSQTVQDKLLRNNSYMKAYWLRQSYFDSNYVYGYDLENKTDTYYILSPESWALVRPALYIDTQQYIEYIDP